MSAFDLRDGEHLERELGALAAEFPSLPRELIQRALAEGLERLERARVSEFVPLLAHRFARDRLRELALGKATSGRS